MEPSDATGGSVPTLAANVASLEDRDVALRFESLGGTGHGCEFGLFQRHFGAEPMGLLRWADTPVDLLIKALETRFEGVGDPENTVLFAPDDGSEWWTRDKRYWMATRSFVSTAHASRDQMVSMVCRRLRFLSRKLIDDLQAAEKIFVYRNLYRNLSAGERERLYHAVRAYGGGTLFCLQYADADHPSGTVQLVNEGVLVGYVDHFGFAANDRPAEPSEALFMALCRKALELMGVGSQGPAQPVAGSAAPVVSQPVMAAGVVTAGTNGGTTPQAPLPAPDAASSGPAIVSGRGRTIVMIGNCQIGAMKTLYARFAAPRTGDQLHYLPNYQELRAGGRELIDRADVVVEQILDMTPAADLAGAAPGVKRVYVPMVTAAFLWPFAGNPHPKNEPHDFLNYAGPYGKEYSDSFLNRMILDGVEPEQGVETYLDLDVRARVNLDRMRELIMDRQRVRDEAAGFAIADIIEQHFRTEPVFLSPYHPNTRVAVTLATQLFEWLGADPADIERMQRCTRTSPFPKDELPIHPGVCRHFGITFVAPDRRWRFLDEGRFTTREFALRYMRYEWNRALAEGMHFLHQGRLEEARPKLAHALQQSPSSAAGHNAMRHILQQAKEPEAALASARLAAAAEPDAATYRAALGGHLHGMGRAAEAEPELRAAVELDPTDTHFRMLLAHVLRGMGRDAEALDHLRAAAETDPFSEGLRDQIAQVTAAVLAKAAAAPAPTPEEAAGTERLRSAQALTQANRLAEATKAAGDAVRLMPRHHGARLLHSQLLLRADRAADAMQDALCAVVLDGTSGAAYLHLANVLRRTGDTEAAEAAYIRAAALMPTHAHVHHELSLLYHQAKRFTEAAEAARRAAELESRVGRRREHLAVMLMEAREYAAAHEALNQALELTPDSLTARIHRGELLVREGRLDDASAIVEAAVANAPRSAPALAQMARIKQARGDLDAAEQVLRRALEIEPQNGGLRNRLAALQAQRGRDRAA